MGKLELLLFIAQLRIVIVCLAREIKPARRIFSYAGCVFRKKKKKKQKQKHKQKKKKKMKKKKKKKLSFSLVSLVFHVLLFHFFFSFFSSSFFCSASWELYESFPAETRLTVYRRRLVIIEIF